LILGQVNPAVNGLSGLPRNEIRLSFRRSTIREQASGQSIVQAVMVLLIDTSPALTQPGQARNEN
jgi:hypothetical protein